MDLVLFATIYLFSIFIIFCLVIYIKKNQINIVYSAGPVSALVYLLFGAVGFLYYGLSDQYVGGVYDIGANNDDLVDGFSLYILVSGSVLAGCVLYMLSTKKQLPRRGSIEPGSIISRTPSGRGKKIRLLALLFSPAPLLIEIIGIGFDKIAYSNFYGIDGDNFLLIRVGHILSMAMIFVLGGISSNEQIRSWKYIYRIILIVYILFCLAQASRRAALMLVLYVSGSILASKEKGLFWRYVLLLGIGIPPLLYLPLYIRNGQMFGLLALPSNIYLGLSSLFSVSYIESLGQIIANVLFGVPLAGYVKRLGSIDFEYFLISLNPLPSFLINTFGMSDWYAISGDLRVARHIPYNAIGELANQSLLWLVLVFIIFGYLTAWLDRAVRSASGSFRRWGYLLAIGLLFFSIFISTQYNLRSVFRYYYYAILISFVWHCYYVFKSRRRFYGV